MDLNHYITARLLQADLISADSHFSKIGIINASGIAYLKNAFLVLANLIDFEHSIRLMYKEYPTLSSLFSENQKNYEFAKYLRNKFVGHVHPKLIEKAIEWHPELRCIATRMDDPKVMLVVNVSLLETAINTYVDEQGRHKIFDSETDLMYPPDFKRFVDFMEVSIRSAIQYLSELCVILNMQLDRLEQYSVSIEHIMRAAETEFGFIKK